MALQDSWFSYVYDRIFCTTCWRILNFEISHESFNAYWFPYLLSRYFLMLSFRFLRFEVVIDSMILLLVRYLWFNGIGIKKYVHNWKYIENVIYD